MRRVVGSDGAVLYSRSALDESLRDLNAGFRSLNYQFYVRSLEDIKNNLLYKTDEIDLKQIRAQIPPAQGIFNVYLAGQKPRGQFLGDPGQACGLGAMSWGALAIWQANSCAINGVWPHELGHVFGLNHTFEDRFGRERVDGSNCHEAGDQICDTPAEPPDYHCKVDVESCQILECPPDEMGQTYRPDVRNYMSYSSPRFCLNHFSPEQQQVMLCISEKVHKPRVEMNVKTGETIPPVPLLTVGCNGPNDRPTIQQAVNEVSGGGTVKICDGTYYENIESIIGDVRIQGAGSGKTTIDGRRRESVVRLDLTSNLEITGLTLINGVAQEGGALRLNGNFHDSQVTLRDVVLKESRTGLKDNEKIHVSGENGGCLWATGLSLAIEDSSFISCEAFSSGGGLYLDHIDKLVVERSLISKNSAPEGAGFAMTSIKDGMMRDMEIEGNEASRTGGGGAVLGQANILFSNVRIDSNRVYEFSPESGAGALHVFPDKYSKSSLVRIEGGSISGNQSKGPAVYINLLDESSLFTASGVDWDSQGDNQTSDLGTDLNFHSGLTLLSNIKCYSSYCQIR